MAQQEEGWPLGLRFLNSRIGLVRNGDISGSVSFSSTMLASSSIPSTDSSSNLDTESTGSFFHDRSITLGNLIGISSFLDISRRSTRARIVEPSKDNKKNHKLIKPWLFSLCSRLSTDAVSGNVAPSLGHYLEVERRTANTYKRNPYPTTSGPNGFSLSVGSQFGLQSTASLGKDGGKNQNRELDQCDGYGAPIVLSRLCG